MDAEPGPEPQSTDPEGTGTAAPDPGPASDRTVEDGAADVRAADGSDGSDESEGSEGSDDGVHVPHEALPFDQWRRRSAAGAALSGIALGLQQVFQPKRELPAFVMEAPGEPEDPDATITLRFDPSDPTRTVAVIRTPHPDGPPAGAPSPEG